MCLPVSHLSPWRVGGMALSPCLSTGSRCFLALLGGGKAFTGPRPCSVFPLAVTALTEPPDQEWQT